MVKGIVIVREKTAISSGSKTKVSLGQVQKEISKWGTYIKILLCPIEFEIYLKLKKYVYLSTTHIRMFWSKI